MASAKLTLIGCYNYLNESDSDLFLNLSLPNGIDKETLVNTILMRGGEFEVIYSNPYFMRDSILTWSKKWYWTFNKWLKVTQLEYNPIDNYDRYESYEDIIKGKIKTSIEDSIETQNEGSIKSDTSAYNVEVYSNDNQQTTTDSNETTRNGLNDTDEDRTIQHTAHLRGNIGVTTSQQMLESEVKIAYINMYDNIADVFLQEYVLPVY